MNEVVQLAWWAYGQSIYYSEDAVKCDEDNSTTMWLMSIFLLMGTLKLVLFAIVIFVVGVILALKGCKHRVKLN